MCAEIIMCVAKVQVQVPRVIFHFIRHQRRNGGVGFVRAAQQFHIPFNIHSDMVSMSHIRWTATVTIAAVAIHFCRILQFPFKRCCPHSTKLICSWMLYQQQQDCCARRIFIFCVVLIIYAFHAHNVGRGERGTGNGQMKMRKTSPDWNEWPKWETGKRDAVIFYSWESKTVDDKNKNTSQIAHEMRRIHIIIATGCHLALTKIANNVRWDCVCVGSVRSLPFHSKQIKRHENVSTLLCKRVSFLVLFV